MSMRSWNFVTLDQISTRVTSKTSSGKGLRARVKRLACGGAPAVLLTALAIISPSAQVQSTVSGNSSIVSVPVVVAEKSHRLRPAFMDRFSKFFEPAFAESMAGELTAIARVGSSLNLIGGSKGVVEAIADFRDVEVWKPSHS